MEHKPKGCAGRRGLVQPINVDEVLVWSIPAFAAEKRGRSQEGARQLGGRNGLQVATRQPPRRAVIHARPPCKNRPKAVRKAKSAGMSALILKASQRGNLRHQGAELSLRHGHIDVAFGIAQRLFSQRLCGIGTLFVEVLAANSGIGQHRNTLGLHLNNAAGNEHELFAAIG